MLKYVIKSMRPAQWIKNLIIFAPLVFSRNLFSGQLSLQILAGFGVFCVLSGSVYIINDLTDLERDRLHPTKCRRPLASGKLSRKVAAFALLILLGLSFASAFEMGTGFLAVAAAYFVLNLLYSYLLKHVVIVDVMSISLGFILRVLAGAILINVPITPWLLMCTMLLALFLGFAKRRHELVQLEEAANSHRRVLMHYSPYFLDQMIMIVTASTVMSYALYTISPDTVGHVGSNHLLYTTPFVLYGIFRYLYLVHLKEEGGSPTRILLTDKPLAANIVLWLITCVLILEGIL